jgi:uncharacterized protein YjaZ
LKKLIWFLLVLIPIYLTSCVNTETSTKEVFKETQSGKLIFTFIHPKSEQSFKIVSTYNLFSNYLSKAKNYPKESLYELYKQEIIVPVYEDCFKSAEYLSHSEILSILNEAPSDFNEFQKVMEKMENTNIIGLVKDALIQSANVLPTGAETNVCIFPSTNINTAWGITAGSGKIIIPYNKFFEDESFQGVLAHEYHHSVWTEKYYQKNKDNTVLDHIIFEGKAVMFEKMIYPDNNLIPIDYRYSDYFWSQIEPDLYKQDGRRASEIIYGGYGLPTNYGYSEGYKMVKAYLDLHSGVTPEEWTSMSAAHIYEESNYKDNYK